MISLRFPDKNLGGLETEKMVAFEKIILYMNDACVVYGNNFISLSDQSDQRFIRAVKIIIEYTSIDDDGLKYKLLSRIKQCKISSDEQERLFKKLNSNKFNII